MLLANCRLLPEELGIISLHVKQGAEYPTSFSGVIDHVAPTLCWIWNEHINLQFSTKHKRTVWFSLCSLLQRISIQHNRLMHMTSKDQTAPSLRSIKTPHWLRNVCGTYTHARFPCLTSAMAVDARGIYLINGTKSHTDWLFIIHNSLITLNLAQVNSILILLQYET